MDGWYRINGKIYYPMVVNDNFPQLRWSEVGETINHRVFPNLENMDVQEVSEFEADVYFQRSQVNPRNW
jgi:hypothetical protein